MSKRYWLSWCCAVVLGLGAAPAAEAQGFPSKPIKIVVGFGPGGLGDITARAIAQKMSDSLGKPVVVDNLPGAGGITAAASVAKAAPDGYTMLLVSGQNAVSPSLFKSLPYDPAADFAMVSTTGLFDFVIIADKASPLTSVQDLVAIARRDPAHFNIGTISVGSVQNLAALLFASQVGLQATTVPFKTTGDVVTALRSNEIQAGFETLPGVIGQIRAGALRAIAVASDHELSLLPGVPTISQSGVPGYVLVSWNGMVVPAKTPRPIIQKLNAEITKALDAPDIRKRFLDLGIEPHASTPEEMQKIYDTDVVRWRGVIDRAKIPRQ